MGCPLTARTMGKTGWHGAVGASVTIEVTPAAQLYNAVYNGKNLTIVNSSVTFSLVAAETDAIVLSLAFSYELGSGLDVSVSQVCDGGQTQVMASATNMSAYLTEIYAS